MALETVEVVVPAYVVGGVVFIPERVERVVVDTAQGSWRPVCGDCDALAAFEPGDGLHVLRELARHRKVLHL